MDTRNLTPFGLNGPYINAPVWPWLAVGWTLAALFVLLLVAAWSRS